MDTTDDKLEALYSKFCKKMETEWKTFMQETKDEITKIKQEKQQIEQEMKVLSKVAKDGDEILSLNISGEKIMVRRSVLTLVQGSNLQVMILNNEKLLKDKEGNIFLDFNPICFKKIVDFLKLKSIEIENKPPPMPVIDPSIREEFEYLANYLGVMGLFQSVKTIEETIDGFEQKSDNKIEISENGKLCSSLEANHRWALGKNTYSQGVYSFEFEILKLLNNSWMLLSMIDCTVNVNSNDRSSYSWKGCYGWAGGNQVYVDGTNNQAKDGYNSSSDFLENDKIVLTLNLEQNTLNFENKRNGKNYRLVIPSNKNWRVHINLHGIGDKVRLANVTKIK